MVAVALDDPSTVQRATALPGRLRPAFVARRRAGRVPASLPGPVNEPRPGGLTRLAVCLLPFAGVLAACGPSEGQTVEAEPQTVERYEVVEETFRWPGRAVGNAWEDISLRMRLTAPSGRRVDVGGFYAGGNRWRTRFAPGETGRWSWTVAMTDGHSTLREQGGFDVIPASGGGFLRVSRENPRRFVLDSGAPFYPLGMQDCLQDVDRSGSPFDDFGMDGGLEPPGAHRNRSTNLGTYLDTYADAGVNFFRWSVSNCGFGLYRRIAPRGNTYLQREGALGDELVRGLRKRGFRVMMTIFSSHAPFAHDATDAQLAAVKRYVKYVVDRYGAYVDVWELMNEGVADRRWYEEIGGYLRDVDPYDHPVSTSWERPDLPVIDVSAPHWYEREDELTSDAVTWRRLAGWKRFGKPVVVGEQGNSGRNWDPRSALRMRLRAWTAFFAEGVLVFWNTSGTKSYRSPGAANLYLGPVERRYLRVLQSFVAGFETAARPVAVRTTGSTSVRGYALRGPESYAAYLHNFRDHVRRTTGVRVRVDLASAGRAQWIAPATGATLASQDLPRGAQVLDVPPFTTDVALKVAREGRG